MIKQSEQNGKLRYFVKMHGTGNDFIIVQPEFFNLSNQRSAIQTFSQDEKELISAKVIQLCNRKFSIGADGVLIISQTESIFKMSIFNADGSMAKQCGNGLRCAAFYLQKLKGFNHHFKINTDSGDKEVNILKSTSQQAYVRICLGKPTEFRQKKLQSAQTQQISEYLTKTEIYSCEIGNRHLIVFLAQQLYIKINTNNLYGKVAEYLIKQQPINVNFCFIESDTRLHIVTYEFGVGVTLACGSGSSVSAYAGFKSGKLQKRTEIITKGGILTVQINDNQIQPDLYLEGPSSYVYSGTLEK